MSFRSVLGGMAVAVAVLIASCWGFWGAIEAFHEGWFAVDPASRLIGLLAYMTPCLICTFLAVLCVRRPAIGGAAFLCFSLCVIGIFVYGHRFDWASLFHGLCFAAPFILIGALCLFGSPVTGRYWTLAAIGVPLVTAIACGAEPAWRVATRLDDGFRGTRMVKGNGVELVWAPQGPGWPKGGAVGYESAKRTCLMLSPDGTHVEDKPVNVWRLPTVDELVRSMTRHGKNCGGVWVSQGRRAVYTVGPDKESPLWDPYSPAIYWWTSTETERGDPLIVTFEGGVFPKPRDLDNPSYGFRAVKAVGK